MAGAFKATSYAALDIEAYLVPKVTDMKTHRNLNTVLFITPKPA